MGISQIMARADAGMPKAQIAQELALSKHHVHNVVSALTVGGNEPRKAREAMAQGSDALLAAIRRARPE
jgi:predicted transcriptional regulator